MKFDEDTTLPNGKPLKAIWEESSNISDSIEETETLFRDLLLTYLLDEVCIQTIDNSHYIAASGRSIKLDAAEFRIPKPDLPKSGLDDSLFDE